MSRLQFIAVGILLLSSRGMAITVSAAVQRELLRNPDIRACYARSQSGQAKQKGKVVLTLDVDRSGKVTAVGIDKKNSTLKEDSLQQCLVGSVQNLILPLPSKARDHSNKLPLSFPPPK